MSKHRKIRNDVLNDELVKYVTSVFQSIFGTDIWKIKNLNLLSDSGSSEVSVCVRSTICDTNIECIDVIDLLLNIMQY